MTTVCQLDLEQVLLSMPEALLIENAGHEIVWLNHAARRLLGLRPGDRSIVPPDAAEEACKARKQVVTGKLELGATTFDYKSYAFADPSDRACRTGSTKYRGGACRTHPGHPVHGDGDMYQRAEAAEETEVYAISLLSDTSELSTIEACGSRTAKEHDQRAAELAHTNTELQQFASVASHDLREPLRKVIAFGDRLKTHNAEALDEKGRDYIDRMQSAAHRMEQLIDGLIQLVRITTQARPLETVDLNAVVCEVLSDLEQRVVASDARVDVRNLPTISADGLQMRELFQNLIANALKFCKKGEAPQVKVRARLLRGGATAITVRDCGIGFDQRYVDQIFKPFRRLHGPSEYAGAGLGLAICEKIVRRHNGRITVKSSPGVGTTFFILLPSLMASHRDRGNG